MTELARRCEEAEGPLPVEYYLWLASIEPDVRVRDLTAGEVAGLIAALRAGGENG
jgi:hypothetical protein